MRPDAASPEPYLEHDPAEHHPAHARICVRARVEFTGSNQVQARERIILGLPAMRD